MKLLRRTQVLKFKYENQWQFYCLFNWSSRDKTFKIGQWNRSKTALKVEFQSGSLPVALQLCFNENINK